MKYVLEKTLAFIIILVNLIAFAGFVNSAQNLNIKNIDLAHTVSYKMSFFSAMTNDKETSVRSRVSAST